jgi:hypothetical protein
VSFTAITLCVASQRVFIIVVYFVIDSVQKIWIRPHIYIYDRLTMTDTKHEPYHYNRTTHGNESADIITGCRAFIQVKGKVVPVIFFN